MGSFWDHFGIVLGSFWDRFGIVLGSFWDRFGIVFGSFWNPFGIVLGSFWDRFWGHFGVLFRPPARKADFLRIVLPPAREHDFRGSGGVQNASKTSPEAVCGRKRAPRASWEALGSDFGVIFGSFWGEKIAGKAA